jgi:hypothetical protein
VRALLTPFASDASPLPEVEGPGARRTLALALVALDEAVGDVPSKLARLDAVVAELMPEERAVFGQVERLTVGPGERSYPGVRRAAGAPPSAYVAHVALYPVP